MIPIIQTLGEHTVSDMLRRAQESEVRARQADAERRRLVTASDAVMTWAGSVGIPSEVSWSETTLGGREALFVT